jgi:integrase
MSIKRIGPNKYQIRVNRVDPKTGMKVNRKTTVTGSRDDAQRAYEELRSEVTNATARPQRIRLHAYAASWLESRELKDTTRRRYAMALGHIIPALGEYYLDSLTPEIIQRYVAARTQKAEGYTVLNELRLLRTMAKDAAAARLCPMVFTDRVRAPKVSHYTKHDPNRLTREQFVETFSLLDPIWKPMALLMVTTGLRWGEASALHGQDVKLWRDKSGALIGEATIRWNNDRGVLVEKHSETKGMERTVPLVPEVIFLLRPLIARAGKGPLFVSRHGRLYASGAVFGRKLWAAEKAAGIPYRVKPHGLRRTWKNIAKHHASREVLKAIGGWSTDEMLEHYDHVESEEKMAAASAVITALGGKSENKVN